MLLGAAIHMHADKFSESVAFRRHLFNEEPELLLRLLHLEAHGSRISSAEAGINVVEKEIEARGLEAALELLTVVAMPIESGWERLQELKALRGRVKERVDMLNREAKH